MLVRLTRRHALMVSLAALTLGVMLLAVGWALVGPPPVSAASNLLRLSVVRSRRDAVRVEFITGAGEAGRALLPRLFAAYAATRAEKLICGDDELAALDRELNRAYKQLDRTAGPLREQIAAEQRGWRIGQRDTCGDAACVADAMRQRIIVLDSQRASLGNEEGQQ